MSTAKTMARDAVRAFNKNVLNPAMRRLAGTRHFYASAVHHTGRRSGKHYVTPVVAFRVTDGFLIPLPYGSHTDWLLNVRAEAGASLRFKGETFAITSPTVIDASFATIDLPPTRRKVFQWFGVKEFLHLNQTALADAPTPAGDAQHHLSAAE